MDDKYFIDWKIDCIIFSSDFVVHLQSKDNGCECHGDSCYCCVHADVKQIHLNHTGKV